MQKGKIIALTIKGLIAFAISLDVSITSAWGVWDVFFFNILIMTAVIFGVLAIYPFKALFQNIKNSACQNGGEYRKNHAHEMGKRQTAFMCDTVNNPAFHSMSGNIYHRNY